MKPIQLLCYASTICSIILVACTSLSRPTATPNLAPITPEPTRTPLWRATVITPADYGQTLEVFIGDIFEIEKVLGDNSPITIGDTRIMQHLPNTSDTDARKERYKAIAAGTTTLSSMVSFPCPHAPIGCQAPMNFIYVTVDVRSP